MKLTIVIKVIVIPTILLTSLLGCATSGARIQSRINEKPAVFAALSKQQQKDIKWGYVKRGFTPDMVYFAFGYPDQIIKSSTPASYVWVYLDRVAINQDVAMLGALQAGAGADSIKGGNGGRNPSPASGSSANFKGAITTRAASSSEAYSLIDLNGNSDFPTIWVAFQNDNVVNVKHVGKNGQTPDDKSGSLGG